MSNKTLEFYDENAMLFVLGTQAVNFTETQDMFRSYLRPGDSILDFGCGSGRDTKYFMEKGFSVVATDGSVELCKIASAYTGIEVRHQLFQELSDRDCYDGIWACSSILHAQRDELPDVFRRMINALKSDGIIYASFKYGSFEGNRGNRYFTDFDENSFLEFVLQFPQLREEKMWVSADVRPGRGDEKWLNTILRKIR